VPLRPPNNDEALGMQLEQGHQGRLKTATTLVIAKGIKEADDGTTITVPISSVSEDRDGDEFSMDGLKCMMQQLKEGRVPLYLDHGDAGMGSPRYGVTDMIGVWIDAYIEGKTLYGTARLDTEDWRGVVLAQKTQAGLPIGYSVGFAPKDSEAKDNGGRVFHDCDLFEVSAVGIPSNPDAVDKLAAVIQKSGVKPGDPELRAAMQAAFMEDKPMGKTTEEAATEAIEETKSVETVAEEAPVKEAKSAVVETETNIADVVKSAFADLDLKTLIKSAVAESLKEMEDEEDEEKMCEDDEEKDAMEDSEEEKMADDEEEDEEKSVKPTPRGMVATKAAATESTEERSELPEYLKHVAPNAGRAY